MSTPLEVKERNVFIPPRPDDDRLPKVPPPPPGPMPTFQKKAEDIHIINVPIMGVDPGVLQEAKLIDPKALTAFEKEHCNAEVKKGEQNALLSGRRMITREFCTHVRVRVCVCVHMRVCVCACV